MPSRTRSAPADCRPGSACHHNGTSPFGLRYDRHGRACLRSARPARPDPRRGRAGTFCSAAASRCGWPPARQEEVGGLIDLTSNFPAPVPAQASLGDLLPIQEIGGGGPGRPPALPQCRRRRCGTAAAAATGSASGSCGRAGAHPPHQRRRRGARRRHAGAGPARRRGPGRAALLQRPAQPGSAARPAPGAGPMDEHGIVPEALAAAARQRGPGCSCSARPCTTRPPS